MILYHGSNTAIENIDLTQCRPFKDFGRGFYTTPVKKQALTMAKRTTRIYKEGKPCVIEYLCDDNLLTNRELKIKQFPDPNTEWAKFVINNRNRELTFRELSIQISFHTEKSLTHLQKTGIYYE